MGVYVNELNLHDSSRELILAGTQQSAELQLALDQVELHHKPPPTVMLSSVVNLSSAWLRVCLIFHKRFLV